jgi:hypothetical protein
MTCELWMRKSVPAQTKKDLESVAYPQLAESTLVGRRPFLTSRRRFLRRRIPAGFYTLRYQLMPNHGNHLGAAPNRDFLLCRSPRLRWRSGCYFQVSGIGDDECKNDGYEAS